MSGLRLAYVTTDDASNIRSWSGTTYHMARALVRQGVRLEYVGPLQRTISPLALGQALYQRSRGRRYLFERDPDVGRAYARQVSLRLADLDIDCIFSPGTIPIAYLDTRLPVVYWTDAPFAAVVGYYAVYSNLCKASIVAGHRMERAAISRADAAVYSSAWAAESAMHAYGADPAKVHVLPFGPNLKSEPNYREVAALIEKRPRDGCRLLFLGVDWFGKGGDRALAVASKLVDLGIPTRLTVVGPPAGDIPESGLIDYLGFIDKSTPSGEAEIVRLLGESHFLCLPSRAESFGIVFCEASAYGVPSVSIRTGGIASPVRHNTNGYLFDEYSFIDSAVAAIAACLTNYDDLYIPLALASHEEYRSRLNWTTSAELLVKLMSRLVAERR